MTSACLELGIGLLVAVLGPWRATQEPAGGERWLDLELPVGFQLDLAEARVQSRADPARALLVYEDGRLLATPRLSAWPLSMAERPSARLIRGGGRPVDAPRAEMGAEFLWDLGDAGWGLLRVLERDGQSVRLELASAAPGAERLERDPPSLSVEAVRGALELSWSVSRPDAVYDVRRRRISAGPSASELVARVLAGEGAAGERRGHWRDEDVPPGALVEYRVARADPDRPPSEATRFGSRARAVSSSRPIDWPIALRQGAHVDLLGGEVDGGSAHVEILYASAGQVSLRPLRGTRLARTAPALGKAQGARPERPSFAGDWRLPDPEDPGWADTPVSVPLGSELAIWLPEGAFGRIALLAEEDGARLVRELDLFGGHVLPRPPAPPSVSWSGTSLAFEFPELPPDVPDREGVQIVCERELSYMRDVWEERFTSAPGARAFKLGADLGVDPELPVVRLRFRQRYAFGPLSLSSEPSRVVSGDLDDPTWVAELCERAFEGLADASYERRVAARGVLEELGEAAWPRLREALDSEDAELASAARELLLAAPKEAGRRVEAVLAARAELEGVSTPAPQGILAEGALQRARALLVAGRGSDPAARDAAIEWARVLALADPDDGLARLAALRVEALREGRDPARATRGEPFALLPPSARRAPREVAWRSFFHGEPSAPAVRAALAASLDPADARGAFVALLADRTLATRDDAQAMEAVELALRVAGAAPPEGDALLLAAAARLVDAPRARLEALAELAELRLAGPTDPGADRPRIELEEVDVTRLVSEIERLREEGEGYVDLVLAPGRWSDDSGVTSGWLDVGVDGLRLIGREGDEGVELAIGVRIQGARDVILERLAIENSASAGLTVTDGSVTVRDATLAGADTAILVQNGSAELERVHLRDAPRRRAAWSIRTVGQVVLVVRDSILASGTLYPADDALVYIESSVLDGGDRTAIQGQRSATVVLRDVFVRGEGAGLSHLEDVLLEGVVIDVGGQALSLERVDLCPEHVVFTGAVSETAREERLKACPLTLR